MSYHKQSLTCAACAYPAARLRKCTIIIYTQMDGQRKYNKEKVLEQAEWDILKLFQEFIRIKLKDYQDDLDYLNLTYILIFD